MPHVARAWHRIPKVDFFNINNPRPVESFNLRQPRRAACKAPVSNTSNNLRFFFISHGKFLFTLGELCYLSLLQVFLEQAQESPMTSSSTLPAFAASESFRRLCTDSLRLQALERLYRRRDTVNDLIGCLEEYERVSTLRGGNVLSINAGRKCSSDSVQSQT
jgi:hypothetical protein